VLWVITACLHIVVTKGASLFLSGLFGLVILGWCVAFAIMWGSVRERFDKIDQIQRPENWEWEEGETPGDPPE
jgi:hypothetical protein